MHPHAVLIYYFYLTKISLFISINYAFLFHIPTKLMINTEKKHFSVVFFEIFLSQDDIFQSSMGCNKKNSCCQAWCQPLVNTGLISQFQENVISFNFMANALVNRGCFKCISSINLSPANNNLFTISFILYLQNKSPNIGTYLTVF